MNRYSALSEMRLQSCHEDLQRLFRKVLESYDHTIICGHRDEFFQEEAVRLGRSEKKWPTSKHNKLPSLAVDAAPYPIDWEDRARFYHFAGFVKAVAWSMGIKIRCGCDWDNDNEFKDQNFHDLPHFELVIDDTGPG